MKVNQLNEDVANGDFKGVHSFNGLKSKFNETYHNNQPIENQIFRWAKNKVKGLGKKGINNGTGTQPPNGPIGPMPPFVKDRHKLS